MVRREVVYASYSFFLSGALRTFKFICEIPLLIWLFERYFKLHNGWLSFILFRLEVKFVKF